jgi:hypothetical protein
MRHRRKMVFPTPRPSEHKTLAPIAIANHLLNCSRRRFYLIVIVVASIVFFVLIPTDKLLLLAVDLPTAASTINRAAFNSSDERGILTLTSEYPHPIIIATVRGYADDAGCKDGSYWRRQQQRHGIGERDLAKITILSSSTTDASTADEGTSLIQVGNPEKITNNSTNTTSTDNVMWRTKFRLDLAAPKYLPTYNVQCYTVDYRVEYVNAESALADFPPKSCSFRGTPTFHRIWQTHEFNNDSKSNARDNWIVRSSTANKNWQWTGIADDSSNCLSWKKQRPYSIVIIGDSQPSYTCHHLLYGLTGDNEIDSSHPKVRCVQIKQTLQNQTTFDRYAQELQNSKEDVIIFNPSGLWEAAYGSLNVFRDNFERLLSFIPIERRNAKSKYRQYFMLAPTTAVHPINYPELWKDDKKWSMTQSRVQAINSMAKDLVLKKAGMHKSMSYDTVSISILPAPWDFITLSREEDPMTPTDMVSSLLIWCTVLVAIQRDGIVLF